ncbi:DMT family transporter [Oscillatoria sp. FACHB-1406]|uniref:DMT family transporter n=1 Tax=Oscillatoria sp. FACHB-1406 TaxID=2692846 RepID=UPI001689EA18|nr:DMT family transporter [Oscillatoria sp. FACHB-1406]MBD2579047.1 DMT family transporter [Oscillatoria sp. FACHB-1406]
MGYIYAIAATLIWAGNFVIARGLNSAIPPISLAFFRWSIAFLALLPFALPSLLEDRKLFRKHFAYLSVTALLGITNVNTLIYIAGRTTQAVNMALIATSSPIFIVIFSRWFYGEKISLRRGLGLAIAVSGVILLVSGGSWEKLASISFAEGDVYMLLASVVFAGYTMLLKRKPSEMRLATFHLFTFGLGWIFLLPFYAIEISSSPPVNFNFTLSLALLYIGILASVVAFVAWNKAIILAGATRAALIYYLIPVFSGFAAWLILGEPIAPVHFLSTIAILTGIILTNHVPSEKSTHRG